MSYDNQEGNQFNKTTPTEQISSEKDNALSLQFINVRQKR